MRGWSSGQTAARAAFDIHSKISGETAPTINIPAGTYPISSTIEISSSVSIVGAGMDQTILQATAEPLDLITVDGNGVNFSLSGVHVKGVENGTSNNTSALTTGLSKPIASATITDCKFTGFTKNSITVKGGTATISNNVIECKAFEGAAGNGIQINNVKVSTISVTENDISNCGALGEDGVINLYNSEADTFSIYKNVIVPNAGQKYLCYVSDAVDASRNYWGTENPDFESGIGYNTGFEENVSVTTEPYYEAATM